MKRELRKKINRVVDEIFDLARPGRCSCWPKCAMKCARKKVRKLVENAR